MDNPRDKAIRQEYGRKPYIPALSDPDDPSSELSHMERMKKVTDKSMFNQRLEAQSEFKKPYLHNDYGAMEHWYPPPFPNFSFPGPEFSGPAPTSVDTVWFGRGRRLPCDIWCVNNYGTKDNCNSPARCKFSRIYGDMSSKWSIIPNSDGFLPVTGTLDTKGGFWDLIINPPESGWNENVTAEKQTFDMTVKLEQKSPDGKEVISCTDKVKMYCDPCPPAVAFAFDDDNTPDTISKDSFIAVYVTGGLGPFTWSVSGTGYSFATAETEELRVNTLSCVDGDCGVDFDSYANVTVTDACGSSVTPSFFNEDCCPATDTFTFDDANTPDTIAPDNYISVYVTGGYGPYTYVAYGEGYTWHSNGEDTLVSSNLNERLDCAAGT